MKIIQSRIYNKLANEGEVIQDRTSLIVWFLSVLYWKELGYEPVLYTDETTKIAFDNYGLSTLYSIIIDIGEIEVDEEVFWASSKIYSVKHFMENYPDEDFIVSDLDFVPFKDPMDFVTGDVLTYHQEYRQAYKSIEELNISENYNIPEFVTGNVDPVNTSILYFKDKDLMKELMEYQFEFMEANSIFTNTSDANDSMVFVEQRLLAEFLSNKGKSISFMNAEGKSVININAMHTGPYKSMEKADYWKWNAWYLKMLKEISEDVYNNLIQLDIFTDIREIIESGNGTYTDKKGRKTEIESFSWDTLIYPRAFEDKYDADWID